MDFLLEVARWFADPDRWQGSGGVPARLVEHLQFAIVPTVIAVALALPPAAWLAHRRIGAFLSNTIVNIGRAVPSFGVLVVAAMLAFRWSISARFWPIVVALVALALPPIFTNAYTAVAEVDRATVEAARGMGLTEGQLLRRIELPLASPVILAGIRIAFIQVLATVPLAAIVSRGGGFGRYVVDGFARGVSGRATAFAGALLLAVLTIVVEIILERLATFALPRGVDRPIATTDVADAAVPA